MPVETKAIVVVGSINMDLVAATERIPVAGETLTGKSFRTYPGGKGANQAVAVARLGYPVKMIGRLGSDAFGTELREGLQEEGVDVSGVLSSEGASGVALIVVSDTGDNCIVVTPGANAMLTPQDLDDNLQVIKTAGIVLTQLEIPVETVEHLAKICVREGVPLILDPAPARTLSAELLQAVDWFTPNETEAGFFIGNNADSMTPEVMAGVLKSKGVRGVALKLGARGAYVRSEYKPGSVLRPFAVHAVDTTAAGDAFNGAFATGLMMGKDPDESARFASAAAALSVTQAGAQPSMATLAEVEKMLAHAT